jgi:hypothetical protein
MKDSTADRVAVVAGPGSTPVGPFTLASGTRVVPLGHPERSAHGSLVCYRARVVRRIGR